MLLSVTSRIAGIVDGGAVSVEKSVVMMDGLFFAGGGGGDDDDRKDVLVLVRADARDRPREPERERERERSSDRPLEDRVKGPDWKKDIEFIGS